MKFFERLMKNDDPNTGRLSMIACMCLLLFIGCVGIGSEYSAGSLSTSAHPMKDMVSSSDADDATDSPACNTQSQQKEGDLVAVSCEREQSPEGMVPL